MILSSMSVMFMTQRHRVAAPAQVADEQVGEQERAEVADVGRSVDRRPAGVDPDVVALERLERPRSRRSACRAAGRSSARLDGRDGQRRDRPPGALGAVEVAGRGLDVDRAGLERRGGSAIAPRIASSRGPSRGGRATIVRSTLAGRQPASARRAHDRREQLGARDARAASRASAGKRRPRSPRPAAPSSASATACSATSPSECPCSAGRAVELDAAEPQRLARPERVAVVADARPRSAGPTPSRTRRPRARGRRAGSP